MNEYFDIAYKHVNGHDLLLDLFTPDTPNPPLILWIHGGAWLAGDRKENMMLRQVARGYAVASIDYRLTTEDIHPAQIIDCKDALWFLRCHAAEYGYDASRVVVAGDSAGGHLAALMGTSAGQARWEQPGADCRVTATVDYYGPTSLTRGWPNNSDVDSVLCKLMGTPVSTPLGRAISADLSPVTYVTPDTPPMQIFHGDRDELVPLDQSRYLRSAMEEAGCDVRLHVAPGYGHGFYDPIVDAILDAFLDEQLKCEQLNRA